MYIWFLFSKLCVQCSGFGSSPVGPSLFMVMSDVNHHGNCHKFCFLLFRTFGSSQADDSKMLPCIPSVSTLSSRQPPKTCLFFPIASITSCIISELDGISNNCWDESRHNGIRYSQSYRVKAKISLFNLALTLLYLSNFPPSSNVPRVAVSGHAAVVPRLDVFALCWPCGTFSRGRDFVAFYC